MIDYSKVQKSSTASSNKVFQQDTGTISVAALGGAGETFGVATIPHTFGSDKLIPQVTTIGGTTDGVILPWESNDGRLIQYIALDASNLYIYCLSSDSSGAGAPAYTITYYYRLLVP